MAGDQWPGDQAQDSWTSFFSTEPAQTHWPTFKAVATLGRLVVAAVVLVVLSDVVEIVGRIREFRLSGDLENGLESVSLTGSTPSTTSCGRRD